MWKPMSEKQQTKYVLDAHIEFNTKEDRENMMHTILDLSGNGKINWGQLKTKYSEKVV
jgi:hypothetical protein